MTIKAKRVCAATAALALLLAVPNAATAGCRSRPSGRAAGKRPLIVNVPQYEQVQLPCPQQPRSACVSPGSARLVVKDSPKDDEDRLTWKWSRDDVDPPSTRTYALCIYDSFENVSLRVAAITVEPGGRWTRHATEASGLADPRVVPAGFPRLVVRSKTTGRTRLKVEATGKRLRLPAPAARSKFFHKNDSVVVQLVDSGSDECWTSTFTTVSENSVASFVAPGNSGNDLRAEARAREGKPGRN